MTFSINSVCLYVQNSFLLFLLRSNCWVTRNIFNRKPQEIIIRMQYIKQPTIFTLGTINELHLHNIFCVYSIRPGECLKSHISDANAVHVKLWIKQHLLKGIYQLSWSLCWFNVHGALFDRRSVYSTEMVRQTKQNKKNNHRKLPTMKAKP